MYEDNIFVLLFVKESSVPNQGLNNQAVLGGDFFFSFLFFCLAVFVLEIVRLKYLFKRNKMKMRVHSQVFK